jgi:hypothetical protein
MHNTTERPFRSTRRAGRGHAAWSLAGLTIAFVAAACSPAGAAPTPSPVPTVRPTPTPIAAKVASPEDAAALVIATDPRFAGTMPLTPDVIGASQWWVATPLATGGYQVELTIGWGDCPAGCIERHTWTFEVSQDGQVEKIAEQGPEPPADLPA